MIASATPRPERYVLSPVSPHAKVAMSSHESSPFPKSDVRLPPMRLLRDDLPVTMPPLNYNSASVSNLVSGPLPSLSPSAQVQTGPSQPQTAHTPQTAPGPQTQPQGAPGPQTHTPQTQGVQTPQSVQVPQAQSVQPPQHPQSHTPQSHTPQSQPIQPIQSQPIQSQPQPQHQNQPIQSQAHTQNQPLQTTQSQPPSVHNTPQTQHPVPLPQVVHQPPLSTTPIPIQAPQPLPPVMHSYAPPPPMTHPGVMMPPYYTPFAGQDFKRKTFESKDTASHMYQMISQLETFVQTHGGDMRSMAHASSSPHTPLPSIDALNAMILRLRSCSAIFDEWRDNVVAIHQAAASTQPQNAQYPPKTTPPASPLFINTNAKRKRKRSRSDASTTVCRGCGTTETPEWRKGPEGARTLCNACGLYHAKLAKRKGINVAGEAIRQKRMRTNLSE
ncbi:Biofilm regulator 1 [Yarrowia sp. B02]|nr:Biofilm regulator 1 [Yarrowia sp. B02]